MMLLATSECPKMSAMALDDNTLVRAIKTSDAILRGMESEPLKEKYRWVNWASLSMANGLWVFRHFEELCEEFQRRFYRRHSLSSRSEMLSNILKSLPHGIPLTSFVSCTEFQDVDDVHLGYQLFLTKRWTNEDPSPMWTNSSPPLWFQDVNDLDA